VIHKTRKGLKRCRNVQKDAKMTRKYSTASKIRCRNVPKDANQFYFEF